MKKIFTLLFLAGSVTIASAQSSKSWPRNDRNESRDVILGHPSSNNSVRSNSGSYGSYTFTAKERDAEIKKINREFDKRINLVKKDRYMRSTEKSRQVRLLERQRDEQVSQVLAKFSSNRNRFEDRKFNNRKW